MILEGTPKGEGSNLDKYWHWDTKAWGANKIRYLGSPRRQRWRLDNRKIYYRR